MKALGNVLNSQQKEQVANAVLRLYLAQGRHIKEQDVVFVVDQIASWGYALPPILKGIQLLHDVKLEKIQLAEIKKAIADSIPAKNNALILNPADKGCCTGKISQLKKIYGCNWWRHFNDKEKNIEEWDAIEN